MQLTLKRTKDGLLPLDDKAVEVISKLKIGEEILIEYKKNRNVKNHRRLFSLLNLIKHNQDKYKSVNNILTECKFNAGYFEIHITQNGEQIYIPKSISFSDLGEDEFKIFFSSCIDTCLTIVNIDRHELEEAILRYC